MYIHRLIGFKRLLVIILFLGLMSIPSPAEDVDADKIIAVVNNMIITQSEVQELINFTYIQLAPQLGKEKLDKELKNISQEALVKLIEDKLILQEAIKGQIEIDETIINGRLQEIKSRFPSEEGFETALLEQNISIDDIKKNLREQELMRKIVDRKIGSKVFVSPREITKFYHENPKEFTRPIGRELSLVYFDNKVDAAKALGKIKGGENFNKLFSNNPNYSALEEFRRGSLDPDVEKEIFEKSPGEFTDIIEINNQYFIFKVLRFLSPQEISFYEAQDRIKGFLFQEKFTKALTEWLDELKNEAYIVIK